MVIRYSSGNFCLTSKRKCLSLIWWSPSTVIGQKTCMHPPIRGNAVRSFTQWEANSHQGRLGFTSCIQNSDWLTGPIVALLFVIFFWVGSISSEPLILSHFSTDLLFVGRRCHTSKADKHGARHCSRAPVHYRYENCSQVPFLTARLGHVRMG